MVINHAIFNVGSEDEYSIWFASGCNDTIKMYIKTHEVSVTDPWCRVLFCKRYSSLSSAYRAVRNLQRKYFGGAQ